MQENVLLTDLYQFTMLQAYYHESMHEQAVFEFFVRKMPDKRNYLVAAGLEQVLMYLENLCFSPQDINYLSSLGYFSADFLKYLADLRFSGSVNAMPEGTVFFPNEPVLQIIAPIMQAQLIESRVINILQFQILIASKAARCVQAAPDKLLVDFGMRRAHGAEAALLAARASYLAGFGGTATVAAGQAYAIPLYGTMAHSYVQAHASEEAAFKAFATALLKQVVLLIDTYDVAAAIANVVKLIPQLQQQHTQVKGVRIDSGDLGEQARQVRQALDAAGYQAVTIFASGDLDEYKLRELQSFPIDGFGVGTKLDTSYDVPYLDCAYKLQEYAEAPRRKKSEGKQTWPGRKQVYRRYQDGELVEDIVTLAEDTRTTTKPLLQTVMQAGKRTATPSLIEIRQHVAAELKTLPDELVQLEKARQTYSVVISKPLRDLADKLDKISS